MAIDAKTTYSLQPWHLRGLKLSGHWHGGLFLVCPIKLPLNWIRRHVSTFHFSPHKRLFFEIFYFIPAVQARFVFSLPIYSKV